MSASADTLLSHGVYDELISIFDDALSATASVADSYARIQKLKNDHEDLPSLLLDVIHLVENDVKPDDAAKRYSELVGKLSEIVPQDVLKCERESETNAVKQSLVRMKTKLYFKQTKFNLIREESEGYAKLMTELLENDVSSKAMVTRVLSLIGQFNLDPNRVSDIIIECFESRPSEKSFFISLLKELHVNKEYLSSLLGYKFNQHHDPEKSTPFSLYVLAAVLIEADIVDFSQLLEYAAPNSEGLRTNHQERATLSTQRTKKAETIMTAHINAESRNASSSNVGKSAGGDDALNSNGDMGANGAAPSVAFSSVVMAQEAEDRKLCEETNEERTFERNQKLGILCALLEIGAWPLATQLLDRMPEYYAVQASTRIAKSITALFDYSIDDFYHEACKPFRIVKRSPYEPKPGVPKATCWKSLMLESGSILNYVGVRIGYSARTLTKLLRLVTAYFDEKGIVVDGDDEVRDWLLDVVDEVLVPAQALCECNAAYSEDLWTLLERFSFEWRYRFYGRWKYFHSVRHADLNIARAKVLGRTKYILKRLSKETVKTMGRQLGKLCHVNAIAVFDYLLSQVQTFDNFIEPVVDSLKGITRLELDILSFSIMEQLASAEREQLKASDGTISPWLQALATMVGSIYKKYSMELNSMLHYVANQLKSEKCFDLIVLREIIQNMSSIESSTSATQLQLEALTGGEQLRLEAGGYSNAKNKRTAIRLRDTLVDNDLALGLCLLIAQHRECIVYKDSTEFPLKLAGEMIDQCHDTFMQFASFLQIYLKTEEYVKRIPPVHELIGDYHLDIPSAFFLARPTYLPKVIASFDASKKAMRSTTGDNKTKAKLDDSQKIVFFKSAFADLLEELRKSVGPCMPANVGKDITLDLMLTFWTLSMYDLQIPAAAYEKTLETTRKQLRDLGENFDMSKLKRQKEEERLRAIETKLKDEERKQGDHVTRVRACIGSIKDELFSSGRAHQTSVFIQMCIIPRAVFSELDAIFCAQFVFLMHRERTTFFQTLVFFDKMFSDVLPLLSGLSELEATSFGRFLEMIMTQAHQWYSDKALYGKECEGFPGFMSKMRNASGDNGSLITHESFKRLCNKWQSRMGKTFVHVLSAEKSDYVQLRNCLVVMTKMTQCFPLMREYVDQIEKAATTLRDNEKGKRNDLSLKAASYLGRLKMRNVTIIESEQTRVKPKPKPAAAATGAMNGTSSEKLAVSTKDLETKKTVKIEERAHSEKPSGESKKTVKTEDKPSKADREKTEPLPSPSSRARGETKEGTKERRSVVKKEEPVEEGELTPGSVKEKTVEPSTKDRRISDPTKESRNKDRKDMPSRKIEKEKVEPSKNKRKDGERSSSSRRDTDETVASTSSGGGSTRVQNELDVCGPEPPSSLARVTPDKAKRDARTVKRVARESIDAVETKVRRRERTPPLREIERDRRRDVDEREGSRRTEREESRKITSRISKRK